MLYRPLLIKGKKTCECFQWSHSTTLSLNEWLEWAPQHRSTSFRSTSFRFVVDATPWSHCLSRSSPNITWAISFLDYCLLFRWHRCFTCIPWIWHQHGCRWPSGQWPSLGTQCFQWRWCSWRTTNTLVRGCPWFDREFDSEANGGTDFSSGRRHARVSSSIEQCHLNWHENYHFRPWMAAQGLCPSVQLHRISTKRSSF